MIILGYPGIGKTTLAKRYPDTFFDLESNEYDKTDPNWAKRYIHNATLISDAGRIVFVSTHKEVQEILDNDLTIPNVYYIIPSVKLKNCWFKKAVDRLYTTYSEKDLKALNRIKDYFEEDINNILNKENNTRGIYIIQDDNYDLKNIIDYRMTPLYNHDYDSMSDSKNYFISGVVKKDLCNNNANIETDNIIELLKEKDTKLYHIDIDEEYFYDIINNTNVTNGESKYNLSAYYLHTLLCFLKKYTEQRYEYLLKEKISENDKLNLPNFTVNTIIEYINNYVSFYTLNDAISFIDAVCKKLEEITR